jgi:hypothetical protein
MASARCERKARRKVNALSYSSSCPAMDEDGGLIGEEEDNGNIMNWSRFLVCMAMLVSAPEIEYGCSNFLWTHTL